MDVYDFNVMQDIFPKWKNKLGYYPKKIALLSPVVEQIVFFLNLFPCSELYVLYESDWNLNERISGHFDLIFSGNVLIHSADPYHWFQNILSTCRTLWIQEPVKRKRTEKSEFLASRCDQTRFHYSPVIPGMVLPSYDLVNAPGKVIRFYQYSSANQYDSSENVSFVAWIEGHSRLHTVRSFRIKSYFLKFLYYNMKLIIKKILARTALNRVIWPLGR